MMSETLSSFGSTDKGAETSRNILEQTKNILSEHGFAAISMRNVAEKCNISPGNVTYYFRTKEILLEKLAEYIFERWSNSFYNRMPSNVIDPKERFEFSIKYMIEENKRPKTMTMLLEMWAISTHNPSVRTMMDIFYGHMRSWIETLLLALNTQQTAMIRQKRAALITAQIEGLMLLIGPIRVRHPELEGLEDEAVRQILRLALTD